MSTSKPRGGKREGAGRKSKVENEWMVAAMDENLSPDEFWKLLAKGCRDGSAHAQRLWSAYRFGVPKQTVAIEGGDKPIQIDFT